MVSTQSPAGHATQPGGLLAVRTHGEDPRAAALTAAAAALGYPTVRIEIADLYDVAGELTGELAALVVDPLIQSVGDGDGGHVVDVLLRPGVTDTAGAELQRAAAWMDHPVTVTSGRRFRVHGLESPAELDRLVRRLLANPVIEHWSIDSTLAHAADAAGAPPAIERVAITTLDDEALVALDQERGLSLDLDQLRAIATHFRDAAREPTDAELETLAQTWSEHCAHTTFRADIVLDDGTAISPLLKQLRQATDTIAAPWVVSAFVGNAGIVQFTPERTLALKAETHNHPSAVEPFGGANTGVGGVIRDVMGAAHHPIAVTDILCFGRPDLPMSELPDGVLHPSRIAGGVVAGIADYGNKIGLPTVAGAVLYDPGYTANPLVYAGCIGAAPVPAPALTGPHPGDRVVVIGGRTGRDGIRGATFSSRTMDAATGEVAGASVQIGDPVVEKLLIDVLAEAGGLYTAITDCGAGGLSSAVGEMAEVLGADVDMAVAPLKYPGLAPWEIWLSEAQERMVLAVDPAELDALRSLCTRHGVELTDLGHFTGDGRLLVRHGTDVLVDLDVAFLHDGRPQRTMLAEWPRPTHSVTSMARELDVPATLLALLAHPNIASKQDIIRRYDHEIRGATVVRPFTGVQHDGPADGVVLAEPAHTHGIAVGIGVNPWYGEIDPERMAHAVVDEAIRNAVAVGGDPDRLALLDNFSWGDPRRPSTLGGLAAAVRGCCDASIAHAAPFVSGKDSLNNEFTGADGNRHAVPPTLVITAVAHVPDAAKVVTPDLKQPGNRLLVVGSATPVWGGSHVDLIFGASGDAVPAPDPDAPARYRRMHRLLSRGVVHSCHDISEGGAAVAVAEMAIGGRLGARMGGRPIALFGEANGRFVIEVAPDDVPAIVSALEGEVLDVGEVLADPILELGGTTIPLESAIAAFFHHSREQIGPSGGQIAPENGGGPA
jgi:phosphoribosylformylglycinamidine synthase II